MCCRRRTRSNALLASSAASGSTRASEPQARGLCRRGSAMTVRIRVYRLLLVAALCVLKLSGQAHAQAQGQTETPAVDDIVAKYLDAKGGSDKLRGVTTVKMSGRIKQQTTEVPVVSWAKRPNMMRRENTNEGQTWVVGFDGKTVWAINPMFSPLPRQITGPAA